MSAVPLLTRPHCVARQRQFPRRFPCSDMESQPRLRYLMALNRENWFCSFRDRKRVRLPRTPISKV